MENIKLMVTEEHEVQIRDTEKNSSLEDSDYQHSEPEKELIGSSMPYIFKISEGKRFGLRR